MTALCNHCIMQSPPFLLRARRPYPAGRPLPAPPPPGSREDPPTPRPPPLPATLTFSYPGVNQKAPAVARLNVPPPAAPAAPPAYTLHPPPCILRPPAPSPLLPPTSRQPPAAPTSRGAPARSPQHPRSAAKTSHRCSTSFSALAVLPRGKQTPPAVTFTPHHTPCNLFSYPAGNGDSTLQSPHNAITPALRSPPPDPPHPVITQQQGSTARNVHTSSPPLPPLPTAPTLRISPSP